MYVLENDGRQHNFTVDDNGVMRWSPSNNIPPADFVQMAYAQGFPVDIEATDQARHEELSTLIEQMRRHEETMSDEERAERAFERRAAFGPNTTVINVFTGTEYKT